ncbi:D-amino acid dehydrogenase [Polynucleobacter sp. Ross1-W9]|uniref:D-amino acid dehydrogenase n=1 Tax=Polynucleobacter parvulilacunae TaxID=1855631 RepID=UPI001C0D6306|nr:D-amino acid dehydrogenase [Polynucleobacter parvulilacunae]MBU3556214.1 D-amino acid dehydrogenase [Polynucleobacter parvulilacunae]
MRKIVVVGAGITGVTTAYALAKKGFCVTLLERHRYPAMETSFANGGQLSASNSEVWNSWSTISKGIKWAFKNNAPLLVHPHPTWHKISWIKDFISEIGNYEKNTIATVKMAIAARELLFSWAEEGNIDFDLKKMGILHIYKNKNDFQDAEYITALLLRGGLKRCPVSPSEIKNIEPTLAGNYYGGFYTKSDSTGDIHKFTCGLEQAAVKFGVNTIYEADIYGITSNGKQALIKFTVNGDKRELNCDDVVICAGVKSRELASQLGDAVNIYPVKGYSITVNLNDEISQLAAPNISLLDDDAKIVTSRLGLDRFRVAGTAEFNGFNKDIRADRIQPLIEWTNAHFPQVSTKDVVPWAGLRPMMPNMLPVVGRGRKENIFYNTGHGHLGWTLSAVTAEMAASILSNKQ